MGFRSYGQKMAAESTNRALKSNKGLPKWRTMRVEDDTPLEIGKKYYGVPMIDVPDDYLLWLLDSLRKESFEPYSYKSRLYEYLKDNEDSMLHNVKNQSNDQ